ncbi:hypothetical protein PIB30_053285 [Stylosanthes scabra]|uniref:Pentatricopeptide repeat-containing protein n=1 Tax=Stylosanthes scabra TaxID=79078 RepID=A0ABU6UH67_9FABA|nr:hypothetical protein [Stylosanthes scabra]
MNSMNFRRFLISGTQCPLHPPMTIPRFFNTLRFFFFFSLPPNSSSSSSSPSTIPSTSCSNPALHFHSPSSTHRLLSAEVSDIVALIRDDVNDLGFRLNRMNLCLSNSLVVEVLKVLAMERVSALRFFDWLKNSHAEIASDPQIGCLVVNNCGLLGNYEAMVPILNEFNLKRVPLRRNAFGFLLICCSDKASAVECVAKMIGVLNEVGGVCQSSGALLLIEMLGVSGFVDMAEFVLGTIRRTASHYNILIRIMCKRGDCGKAGDLVKEMKRSGCDPNRSTYNLLISCLCKNGKLAEALEMVKTMDKECVRPDAITYDIFISLSCKHCRFDLVSKLLDEMNLKGIEPSISTHAAVIKSYFASGKYAEAHDYVVGTTINQSCSSNANYSLLADLHLKADNVLLAQKILFEMMDKGLKPNFPVYMNIRKRLQKKKEMDLSKELSRRYLNFIEK